MHEVNPLALYVPIKPEFQQKAKEAVEGFVGLVEKGLDKVGIVHFALLTAIPTADGNGVQALMLHTTFDGAMNPYLEAFWNELGTRMAFAGLAMMALNPPEALDDLTDFQNFINDNNLAKDPETLYRAYDKTVKQIKGNA